MFPWRMTRIISSHSVKHVPERTCVACRRVKAKRELVRLVCIADGIIDVDIGGKKAGRGAYLCPTQQCWEIGVKSGRLEYTLRTTLSLDKREHLLNMGKAFFKEQVNGKQAG